MWENNTCKFKISHHPELKKQQQQKTKNSNNNNILAHWIYGYDIVCGNIRI